MTLKYAHRFRTHLHFPGHARTHCGRLLREEIRGTSDYSKVTCEKCRQGLRDIDGVPHKRIERSTECPDGPCVTCGHTGRKRVREWVSVVPQLPILRSCEIGRGYWQWEWRADKIAVARWDERPPESTLQWVYIDGAPSRYFLQGTSNDDIQVVPIVEAK